MKYIDVMENVFQYISIGLYMIIPVGVLALCISIIYKRIRGKNVHSPGTSFVGEYLFKQWETKEKRAAIEEIQYERDEKREDAESGEPPEPGDKE
jgi:hypothetical protein